MKIFAISDLHLSINNDKPMDVFGPVWEGYLDKIENEFQTKVSSDDLVLISGDLSWAMRFDEAIPDINYICSLNGKKVICKGNHDYWWSSISRLREILTNNTYAIQNDAIRFDGVVVCGSRGWTVPEVENVFKTEQDEKIFKRELIRMELSLQSANAIKVDGDKIIVMTHFPPFNYKCEQNEFMNLFEKYGVNAVVFGHLHSYDKKQKLQFERNGIKYYLTSCDLVDNTLIEIDI